MSINLKCTWILPFSDCDTSHRLFPRTQGGFGGPKPVCSSSSYAHKAWVGSSCSGTALWTSASGTLLRKSSSHQCQTQAERGKALNSAVLIELVCGLTWRLSIFLVLLKKTRIKSTPSFSNKIPVCLFIAFILNHKNLT